MYTQDLLSLNKHFLSVVRSQKSSNTIKNTNAINLLHNVDVAMTNQINTLENFDDLMDESNMQKVKDKAATIFGSIAGTIDSVRKDAVSKMIRDDYTALSMIAGGYTMLHTAAIANEHTELAQFSSESLQTIAQLITETSQVLPMVVAAELTTSEENALAVGEKALNETQKAWKPEALFEEN